MFFQENIPKSENQEAAKWGVTKWGLSDASASADVFCGLPYPLAIVEKVAFWRFVDVCRLLLLGVLRPFLVTPRLWHGLADK